MGFIVHGDYNYDEFMLHVYMILNGLIDPVPKFS